MFFKASAWWIIQSDTLLFLLSWKGFYQWVYRTHENAEEERALQAASNSYLNGSHSEMLKGNLSIEENSDLDPLNDSQQEDGMGKTYSKLIEKMTQVAFFPKGRSSFWMMNCVLYIQIVWILPSAPKNRKERNRELLSNSREIRLFWPK